MKAAEVVTWLLEDIESAEGAPATLERAATIRAGASVCRMSEGAVEVYADGLARLDSTAAAEARGVTRGDPSSIVNVTAAALRQSIERGARLDPFDAYALAHVIVAGGPLT